MSDSGFIGVTVRSREAAIGALEGTRNSVHVQTQRLFTRCAARPPLSGGRLNSELPARRTWRHVLGGKVDRITFPQLRIQLAIKLRRKAIPHNLV